MRNKEKKFESNEKAKVSYEGIENILSEAPVLGIVKEKRSACPRHGCLIGWHFWTFASGKRVERMNCSPSLPTSHSSKVLSKNERNYGAPKAEVFVVVTFVKHFCLVSRREIFWINRH